LRNFWDHDLVHGQYPFAMKLMMHTTFVWRGCQFLREISQQSRSVDDWVVSSEVYVGYHPVWALRPGAMPMPVQSPVLFDTFPDPIGYLIPEPIFDIEIESAPEFLSRIDPYLLPELGPAIKLTDHMVAPRIKSL